MNPRVSVILPVYNGELYVARAIESVLSQEIPVCELIVIDDGSQDGTQDILARFGSRIQVRRIPNGGVANAMSVGVSLATGDWIAFIDHDAIWFRSKLKRHAEMIARFPEAGFFCSNFAVRPNGLGRRLVSHFSRMDVRKILERSGPYLAHPIGPTLHENIVGTSTSAMVRMDVVRQVGAFDSRYKICGDYDYWLRCALQTSFIVCPEMLFYKRTHAANISADEIRTLSEHRLILREFARLYAPRLRAEGLTAFIASEIASIDYRIGSLYFEVGQKKEAFGYYRQAWAAKKDVPNTAAFLWMCFKKGVRAVTGNRLGRKASRR